ncbi:DUF4091 domain-containing protein [Cohnella zeiphila]|uniref:DUF4091 domain-containing protein n=1 Tax=Cohnella zeiphila TaxID=2761120 RepID=A0A7X0VUY3_9BACL|nr:DUF4091 domain-containing protein [Cohnella zeiphila]MBB6729368.1 DUF4091 domain-containing protein [Cohnella zeiphila]
MRRKGSAAAALLLALQAMTVLSVPRASAETDPSFRTYVPTNMDKILRDQLLPEQTSPELRMAAARNEYEGAQVIVRSGDEGLSKLQVQVSDLKQEGGSAKIDASDIGLFGERYIQVTQPTSGNYPTGWYPDALVPLDGGMLQVEPNRNQGIYIKVYVPKGLPAGVYSGELTLHETGNPVRIPIEFTVWDFELTDESHTQTAFTLWGDQIAFAHGNVQGDDFWKLLDKYYWASVDHRLTPSYLPIPADDPDTYVEKAIPYITNPKVSAYRLPFYRNADGTYDWDKMKRVVDLLREKGLLSKAFYYITELDEPGPAKYPRVREMSEELAKIAPEVRHFVTTQPVDELTGSVHSWVALVNKYDEDFAHDLQARGHHVWWYTSVVPKDPFPAYHTDDDLLGSRLLSWEQKDYGVEGTLYWSTTIFEKWNGSQYVPRDVWNDPMAFPGANGDGYLFYPGTDLGIDGPVASLRMENLREGAEDYEYLWQLEQRLQDAAQRLGVAGEANVQDAIQPYYDRLFTNMRDYPDDPNNLMQVRREIAGLIEQSAEGPLHLVTVQSQGDSARQVTVYAEKGAQVSLNGEPLEPAGGGDPYDKYVKTLELEPGLQPATVEIAKDGAVIDDPLKLQVGPAYPYAAPLNDAETAQDLARWTPSNVNLSLSDEFATGGTHSLEAQFKAGVKFPNIRLFNAGSGFKSADWSKYGALEFDVRNTDPGRTAIFYVKFHQTNGKSDDTHLITVPAGQSRTVSVPLSEVKLDLTQIKGIELWMFQMDQPLTLAFDSFRLTSATDGDTMVP